MSNYTMILRIGNLPPGPNSSGGGSNSSNRKKGLLGMHFTEYSNLKASWNLLVQSAVTNALENSPQGFTGYGIGPVWLMVVRFSTSMMDRDNAWASMKPVLDGIVRARVIADDNETILPWPRIVQVKVPSKDQCGLVIMMRLMTDEEKNELISLRTWAKTIGKPTTGMVSGSVEDTDY